MSESEIIDRLVVEIERQATTIDRLRREMVGAAADLECRRHAAQGRDPLARRLRKVAKAHG